MSRCRVVLGLAAVCGGLVACADDPPAAVMCSDLGMHVEAATAPDRRLIGAASAYPADGMLAARTDELETSQRARRAAAWGVIRRVLEPAALAEPTAVPGVTIPRFRTWYDREDVARIFQHAYAGLGPEGRAMRARISEPALDEAFGANLHVLDGLPEWTPERWAAYVASFRDELDIAAVGGLRRIAISPDAARHVARSYPEILRCVREGSPPPFADGVAAPQQLAREAVTLGMCERHVAGPFYVASESTIRAHVEGGGDATVRLLEGATIALAEARCSARGELGCESGGPGVFFAEVTSAAPVNAMLEVTYSAPDVAFAGCLDGVFPLASASVAEQWQRVELGPLPTFDTSGDALAARLAAPAEATWGEGDGSANPGPNEIFTVRVPAGGTFRLAGMHIRTRELDHWMNITMWWSDRPDETFGADRPDAIRALGGPWSNYAMCVSIDDVERDPDPTGGFADSAPSLGAALSAVRDGTGASWCSNPYIDAAPGLVRSNCVGCHQHAMSGVRPGMIVMDEAHYPAAGRTFVRNNFPGDQFWGLDAGDDLAVVIQDTVDYWDTAPPP